MTTFDPDTAEQDKEVLLRIHRELAGQLALDCEVPHPGTVWRSGCPTNDRARNQPIGSTPRRLRGRR
jgi:hypothetical protein